MEESETLQGETSKERGWGGNCKVCINVGTLDYFSSIFFFFLEVLQKCGESAKRRLMVFSSGVEPLLVSPRSFRSPSNFKRLVFIPVPYSRDDPQGERQRWSHDVVDAAVDESLWPHYEI